MAKPSLAQLLADPGAQLILTSCKLTALPDAVRARRDLAHLGLSKNRLEALPDWIGELTALRSLYVDHNPLTALTERVADLPQLERLTLSETNLRTLPERLARSAVKFLHLDRMTVMDWPLAIAALAGATSVSSLALNGNPSVADHLDGLRALPSLRHLYLTECGLTRAPASLAALPALMELSLVDNPIAHVPDAVALAPSLRTLILPRGREFTAERKRIKALRPELTLP